MLAFDFETELFGPGNQAPRAVCLTWGRPNEKPQIVHAKEAEPLLREWFTGDELLVGQNVGFDTRVICANWPQLTRSVFAKYERDQITCTKIREQIIDIALGRFRGEATPEGTWAPRGYSLDDLSHRYFGRRLQKDGWRLFYAEFVDTPLPNWIERAKQVQAKYLPELEALRVTRADEKRLKNLEALVSSPPETALTYPLTDAEVTCAVAVEQEAAIAYMTDQFRQARAQFALGLTSAWGMRTDPAKVEIFAQEAEEHYQELKAVLVTAGLVRPDKVMRSGEVVPGAADTKKAQKAMRDACAEEGIEPLLTPGGAISLGAEACDRVDDELIAAYSDFQTGRKVVTNDVAMLRDATGICHPQYDMTATGRTTCSGPNIQALRKKEGIRECFVPSEGCVFIQCDYPSLELFTRAEWCMRVFGFSQLGVTLNAGKDAHLQVAAGLLNLTYDEALAQKGTEEVQKARQAAKAINFGLPGGLGITKLIRYAKNNYGVVLTEEQAKSYKRSWLEVQREVKSFFDLASDLCNNESGLGGETSPFTGQQTRKKRYSELCNERFQRLGADCAKRAMWLIAKACYAEPGSPLYGSHPIAFVHDEIICETPKEGAAGAARELARLMKEGANEFLKHVPMRDDKGWPLRLEPCIMTCWSKKAKPTYNEQGELIPWEPKFE